MPSVQATSAPETIVYETRLSGLQLLHRGKVRDVYAIDADSLLIVTSDRLSAFDVVLPDPIPGKGQVLNQISNYWFARTGNVIGNHLLDRPLEAIVSDPAERAQLAGRSVVAQRLHALPIEAVVRGYLSGSGWKDYQATGAVCGHLLPPGLQLAQRLPAPIFTPATKAAIGDHDENIDFDTAVAAIGRDLAVRVRAAALALYQLAAEHVAARGIIIADTKFEFGTTAGGELVLIDEALTPDSSRFWPADSYRVGVSPPSFDKQYVRDYLETLSWDKRAPGPRLPAEVIRRTGEKYYEALRRLTGPAL